MTEGQSEGCQTFGDDEVNPLLMVRHYDECTQQRIVWSGVTC